METLPTSVLAEAFALSRSRGADLLVQLGDFDVWRGSLSEMRRDSPHSQDLATEANNQPSATEFFSNTLIMARALELLQPICRATLAALYLDHKDSAELATDLDTGEEHAKRLIMNCERRLLEVYTALKASDMTAAAPEWALEREHAATTIDRRRGR